MMRGASGWSLPSGRWVLHTALRLGNLTDRWLEVLSGATDRYDSRLLGLEAPADAARSPRWLVAADRPDRRLAWRAMLRSHGVSTAWLARGFRDRRPSVVHAHYGPIAASQLPFARRLAAPLVASFYGYDASERRFTESGRWRRAYGRLFDASGALVVEGPHMGSRLEGLGCPAEKIEVIRLPADVESLGGVRAEREPGFLVSIAGRFDERKGFDLGIRAFARALRGREDAALSIAGGGELEPEYRRIVAEEGIAEQVRWAGRLPFERFMAEIGAARVGLYPSRTAPSGASEGGAPVTLIESQWLGVPAIVSSHDDLPFVAAPEGAIVLPPGDVDAWAEALLELYRDPARLEAMGRAARAFVVEHHSPEANVRAREAVYDRAG